MAITSGFFNSVNGDRKYNAEQINEFFGQLISSGVLPNPSTNLQVKAKSGMTVQVLAGKGFIDSHWVKNDAAAEFTLDTADSVLNRIDAIIMKLDLNTDARTITIEVKKGTPASSPTAPTMTRTTAVKEYCLATVYVGKTVTSISQSNITDTRANTDVCGWVTGLITQVDTADLFIQYQSAYEEQLAIMNDWFEHKQTQFDNWFNALTSTLNVNTYIQRYHKTVEITEPTNMFNLDMSGYTYDPADVIFVNVNGVMLTETYDYTINTNVTPPRLDTKNSMDASNILEITVLKSKIGQTSGSGTAYANGDEVDY